MRRARARVVRWGDREGRCGGRLVARGAALPRQRQVPFLRAGVAIQGAARGCGCCCLVPGQAGAPWWGYQVAMGHHSMPAQPRAAGSTTHVGVDGSSPEARAGWCICSHCPVQAAGAPWQGVHPHHIDLWLWPSLGFWLEAGSTISIVGAAVCRAWDPSLDHCKGRWRRVLVAAVSRGHLQANR